MYTWTGLIDNKTTEPISTKFSRIFLETRGVFIALFFNPGISFRLKKIEYFFYFFIGSLLITEIKDKLI